MPTRQEGPRGCRPLPAAGFPAEEDDARENGKRTQRQTDDDKIQRLSRIPHCDGLRPRPATWREFVRGILRGSSTGGQVRPTARGFIRLDEPSR